MQYARHSLSRLLVEVQHMENEAYCENGECRVVFYRIGEDDSDKHYLQRDPVGVENCPGCGRFGRLKDDPKAE